MKIAVQGAEGSFHHIAAEHYYGTGHDLVFCDTFSAVFVSLLAGAAEVAVVAVENSLHGSIPEVYSLMQKYGFPIVGEVDERVNQCLITFPEATKGSIKRIYSHPVALAQCAHFLAHDFPGAEIVEHADTAAAVEYIKRNGDHAAAAIASRRAAEIHGMHILQADVQDEPLNYTRFLVLKPGGKAPADADKASLILTTSHKPGSLYHALGVFNQAGTNLTKLRSRPIAGERWKYQFYVDVEITPPVLKTVIKQLEAQGCSMVTLGIYKAARTTFED